MDTNDAQTDSAEIQTNTINLEYDAKLVEETNSALGMLSVKADMFVINNALEIVGGISALAKITQVSERTVYAWKNGSRRPKRSSMVAIERALRDYRSYTASSSRPILPPQAWSEDQNLQSALSARSFFVASSLAAASPEAVEALKLGTGQQVLFVKFHSQQNLTETLPFSLPWLESKTKNKDNLCLFLVTGRAMEPIFSANDICLVDCADTTLVDDKVYLIKVKDSLYLRRFFQTPDKVYFRSSCREFEYQDLNLDPTDSEWAVVGKIIWVGKNI